MRLTWQPVLYHLELLIVILSILSKSEGNIVEVCVIGAGYVGLVTSCCLAYLGHHVVVVEANPDRLAMLKKGTPPIFEPGLEELMKSIEPGMLEFSDSIDTGVKGAEIIF